MDLLLKLGKLERLVSTKVKYECAINSIGWDVPINIGDDNPASMGATILNLEKQIDDLKKAIIINT